MKQGGSSWWKWGCAGCGGCVVLLGMVAAVVFLMARGAAESEEIASRVLQPDLPSSPGAIQPPDAPGLSPDGEARAVTELPAAGGRVILELSEAEFRVEPAPEGEGLRIDATFDVAAYELTEQLDAGEGGPWVYRAAFRRKGASFITGLKELMFGGRPEVVVQLPRDVPLDLEFSLQRGGTEMELGGLWLRSADLRFQQGGFSLGVGEPLREPMGRLTIEGSMGGFAAGHLGNASPSVLDLDVRMGGMSIDLRGEWKNDSTLTLRTSMGGGALRLPRDVAIEGLGPAHRREQPSSEVKLPTLTFTPETTTDDLEIID